MDLLATISALVADALSIRAKSSFLLSILKSRDTRCEKPETAPGLLFVSVLSPIPSPSVSTYSPGSRIKASELSLTPSLSESLIEEM